MSTFKSFEDIDAWKKARKLTNKIYSLSGSGMFSKDFPLRDQIKRAGVSVMSNIAEGFDRGGTKEFVQFLSIAKGSVGEIKSQLYIALDQRYFDEQVFKETSSHANEVGKMIAGLMRYFNRQRLRVRNINDGYG